jgi:Tol biopolymer transport system component
LTETSALQPKASAEKTQSRWRRAALAGTIAIVALVGIGFALYKFLNPAPLQFEAKKMTRLTASGRIKVAVISPDGKFVVYSQEEYDGQQSLWMQHIGSESSAQIAAPAKITYHGLRISPDGNSLYYIADQGTLYRMLILGGMAKKIVDGTMVLNYSTIGISPDGKQIAFVRRFEKEKTALLLINADGTDERTLAAFEPPIRLQPEIEWSPDGKVIACRIMQPERFNILAVQVADGTNASILPPSWTVDEAVWLPDSKSLLMTGGNGKEHGIWQISYPNGEVRQATTDSKTYDDISISADGRFLTGIRREKRAYIWRMPNDDSTRAQQLTGGYEKCDGGIGLSWLPDGRLVYGSCASEDSSVVIMDADGSNAKELLKNGGMNAVSPDGRFVVYRKVKNG